MDFDKDFIALIKKMVGNQLIKTVIIGTAVNVTDTNCTVQREERPDILDVRLNAIDDDLETYVTVVPKENSNVLVAIIENEKKDAVVITCSEVEKVMWKCGSSSLEFKDGAITFNGGDNDGLVIDAKVASNLTTIKNYILGLQSAIVTALGTIEAVTGTGTLITPFNTTMSAFNMNMVDMKNDKIKH